MTRDFYFFGRTFFGLAAFCGLLQTIVFFFLGDGVDALQVFPVWYLVATLVQLASLLFMYKVNRKGAKTVARMDTMTCFQKVSMLL
jgi:hypothetical protein